MLSSSQKDPCLFFMKPPKCPCPPQNHLVRLIPGLQRIDGDGGPAAGDEDDDDDNDDDIEEESTGVVMRPYLSEAWLVKSGGGDDCESPVASRVCTAVDMKMRLRYWARKVAMAVQRDL